MILSVEMVAVLTGATGAMGLIALFAYFYLFQKIRALESSEFKSVKEIVEGEGIFNADQVIHILNTFETDTSRLAALRELAKVQARSADGTSRLYGKIKQGISVTELQKERYAHLRRLTIGVAPFFFLMALTAVGYGAYSNPEVATAVRNILLGRPGKSIPSGQNSIPNSVEPSTIPPKRALGPHQFLVYGPVVRISSGGVTGGNPGCAKRVARSCAKSEHGGLLVPASGIPMITSADGRVGSSIVEDSSDVMCIEFWASTGACEVMVFIEGRAVAVEQVGPQP